MLQAAAHMLDVQFGQASDFGKVRTNNEDAMGSFIPARASRPAPTAISLPLPTASAAWIWAKSPRPRPSPCSPRSLPKRRPAPCSSACCRASSSTPMPPCTTARSRPQYRGKKDGHHARRLRPALRPGRRLARRRLALLPGPQRPGPADHAGSHLVNEQRKMGLISAARSPNVRFPPRAHPLAGAGDVRLARHHRRHPAAGRRAGALHRRPARRNEPEPRSPPSSRRKKTSTRSPASSWPAPSKSTAATTPPRRSSACARWSRWACTAAALPAAVLSRAVLALLEPSFFPFHLPSFLRIP
jgi:hypothetical protein